MLSVYCVVCVCVCVCARDVCVRTCMCTGATVQLYVVIVFDTMHMFQVPSNVPATQANTVSLRVPSLLHMPSQYILRTFRQPSRIQRLFFKIG